MFTIVGLGNPGAEYENTRHNTGAMVLEVFRKAAGLPDWKFDGKRNALVSSGKLQSRAVLLIRPQTFMNRSGAAVRGVVKSRKGAERFVVIHDDLDIPFGRFKISFNKSSGGHKGVESVIRAAKTQVFVRVRVGIAPSAAAVRKPRDEAAVGKTILGKYTAGQLITMRNLAKRIAEGLVVLVVEGREKAMSQYQS